MKAEEFYKQRSNSIRELWELSPKQIEYIALIMEEYAALRQPPVINAVCKHCGKAKAEHTTASGMCKDKFKFFEQTDL